MTEPLGEILHASFKQWLVLVACDVLGYVLAATLGVTHLAKDSSTWGCDAFDGEE